MALIKCPECGKQISNKAEVCPHCGINLKEKKILHKDPEEIKEAVEVTDTSSKYDSENNVIDNTANGDIKSKDTNIEVKNNSKKKFKNLRKFKGDTYGMVKKNIRLSNRKK